MAKTDSAAMAKALNQAVTKYGSEELRTAIGTFGLQNLPNIGKVILQYEPLMNEFTNMVCKIAETWVRQKNLRNPLALLKRATPSPLGLDIEEVFVNAASATKFDKCGSALLDCKDNDIKPAYHRRNREEQYEAYVSRAQMQSAFTSWDKMDDLIQNIVNSLFNGNRNDEWTYSKALFGQGAVDGVIMNKQGVAKPVDEATGKAFVKAARTHALNMQMPGTSYNSYYELTGAVGNPVITQTYPEDLICVIRTDVLSNIDVDVLAMAFNMSKADFIGRVIAVDQFTDNSGGALPNQLAFIGDQNVPVIVTQLEETSSFWNAKALKWTYYLTMFQIWSLSPFWNGVMLTSDALPTP